jgi:hypothetical protein
MSIRIGRWVITLRWTYLPASTNITFDVNQKREQAKQ